MLSVSLSTHTHTHTLTRIFTYLGQEMQAMHYEAPKPHPMVRPAYLNFVASPAALSFNFAIQSYQPQPASNKRNQGNYNKTRVTYITVSSGFFTWFIQDKLNVTFRS